MRLWYDKKMYRPKLSLFIFSLALLGSLSCKSLKDGAKENFSKAFSCPEDRVEVRERKDLSPYEVMSGPRPEAPAEIQSDPGRLELWQKKEKETSTNVDNRFDVFEVRGCEKQVLYYCAHPDSDDGQGTKSNVVSCVEGKYPAGAAKW
jgi:hypothetical protein